MLDGEAIEVADVGFAGIAGFGGGFGRGMLNTWAEPLIKDFNRYSRLQCLCARAPQNRQTLSNCRAVAASMNADKGKLGTQNFLGHNAPCLHISAALCR